MSKLYTKISIAVVSLLCSQAYIHTMEPECRAIPSLRKMCVKYISEHIDEVNALSHLSSMPVELASNIVFNMGASVVGDHKDVLISCIEKKDLDSTVLAAIACRLDYFKTCLNDQMDKRLAEIKGILETLNKGISDPIALTKYNDIASKMLTEYNNMVSKCSSDKFVLPLTRELTAFIELAIKIHNNRCENGNSDDHQVLLQELSMQADICIKEINALKVYASTISIPNLAHDIAKSGPLTFKLARAMVKDFLNTEIPDSFDDLCNLYFPEDMATSDNYKSLYLALAKELIVLPVKIAGQFSAEEFEKQLSATVEIKQYPWIEVAYNANKKDNCVFPGYILPSDTIISAVFNPKYNIFLVYYFKKGETINGTIVITNTKTMLSSCMSFSADEVKQIGLNEDCTQLGILDTDDSIISFMVPSELVSFTPSLQQRVFLPYFQRKIFGALPMALRIPALCPYQTVASLLKQHIKKNISLKATELKKICEFAKENKGLIPTTLVQALFDDRLRELRNVSSFIMQFVQVAKHLNLTVEELCDKVISEEITSSAFMDYLIAAL